MSTETSQFDIDFNNYFINSKKNSQFNVTMKFLYTYYPTVFRKGKNNRGIEYFNEEEAKKIMKPYYIPDLIKAGKVSVHYSKSTYKDKEYNNKYVYTKHRQNKFAEMENIEGIKNILNEQITTTEKATKIKELYPNETKDFTTKQIYAWIYRNL